MKRILTLLLLAGMAGGLAPEALATPDPAKKTVKIPRKKGMFGKRPRESSYVKALRRNELLR